MTRTELAALVVLNIGGRTDKDTVINQGLNFGLKHYSQLHDFKTRKLPESDDDLTSGQETLTLAGDATETIRNVAEIRLIDSTQSYSILIKDKNWIVSRYPNPTADNNSRPIYCYQEAEKLYFYPVPDDDYSITYTYVSDEVDFTTDNPIYLLDEALASYATYHVFRSMEKFQQALMWKSIADSEAAVAISRDRRNFAVRIAEGFRGAGYGYYTCKQYNELRAGVHPTSLA